MRKLLVSLSVLASVGTQAAKAVRTCDVASQDLVFATGKVEIIGEKRIKAKVSGVNDGSGQILLESANGNVSLIIPVSDVINSKENVKEKRENASAIATKKDFSSELNVAKIVNTRCGDKGIIKGQIKTADGSNGVFKIKLGTITDLEKKLVKSLKS